MSIRIHRKLLIAEDIEDNYLLCKAYLENKYSLIRAHDGEEAISLFLQHSPDAILMDLRMPCIDGYQATEAIRQMSFFYTYYCCHGLCIRRRSEKGVGTWLLGVFA